MTDFNIDPNGIDLVGGGVSTPWKRLTRAAEDVTASDRLLVRGTSKTDPLRGAFQNVGGLVGVGAAKQVMSGHNNISQGEFFNNRSQLMHIVYIRVLPMHVFQSTPYPF